MQDYLCWKCHPSWDPFRGRDRRTCSKCGKVEYCLKGPRLTNQQRLEVRRAERQALGVCNCGRPRKAERKSCEECLKRAKKNYKPHKNRPSRAGQGLGVVAIDILKDLGK